MDVAVIQLFMNNRPDRVDWTVLSFWLIFSGLHSTGAQPVRVVRGWEQFGRYSEPPCNGGERVGTIQVLFGATLQRRREGGNVRTMKRG